MSSSLAATEQDAPFQSITKGIERSRRLMASQRTGNHATAQHFLDSSFSSMTPYTCSRVILERLSKSEVDMLVALPGMQQMHQTQTNVSTDADFADMLTYFLTSSSSFHNSGTSGQSLCPVNPLASLTPELSPGGVSYLMSALGVQPAPLPPTQHETFQVPVARRVVEATSTEMVVSETDENDIKFGKGEYHTNASKDMRALVERFWKDYEELDKCRAEKRDLVNRIIDILRRKNYRFLKEFDASKKLWKVLRYSVKNERGEIIEEGDQWEMGDKVLSAFRTKKRAFRTKKRALHRNSTLRM
jgi:hypothetical protein